MKQKTIGAINKLNRDFYKHLAPEFHTSRQKPWLGMNLALKKVALDSDKIPKVLDIGCGNGRFLISLKEDFNEVYYTGVDNNEELLTKAKEQYPRQEWIIKDVVAEEVRGKFDLVGVFGLMHHIPGRDLRIKKLKEWINCLEPEGKMIVSYWQEADKRSLSNQELESRGIEFKKREAGDYYLGWNKSDKVRFCHCFSLKEVKALEEGIELEVFDSFEADGKSKRANLYRIYQSKGKNVGN